MGGLTRLPLHDQEDDNGSRGKTRFLGCIGSETLDRHDPGRNKEKLFDSFRTTEILRKSFVKGLRRRFLLEYLASLEACPNRVLGKTTGQRSAACSSELARRFWPPASKSSKRYLPRTYFPPHSKAGEHNLNHLLPNSDPFPTQFDMDSFSLLSAQERFLFISELFREGKTGLRDILGSVLPQEDRVALHQKGRRVFFEKVVGRKNCQKEERGNG